MTPRHLSRDLLQPGTIVGTVHSADSLRAAGRAAGVDWLELRVDHFAENPDALLRAASGWKVPAIVTVRHPAEGGRNDLGVAQRRALYTQFLPVAAAIDVELRSMRALAGIVNRARARGVRIIVSMHDFRTTPSAARLMEIVHRSTDTGADVVKIATRAESCADLHRLLGLFTIETPRPLSVMAMGRFGKVSRLLFARAGSVLNYAYLGTANASGQWPAAVFRQRLAEIEG